VIRINVIMAIKSSGMCWPKRVNANTSLGIGQGTVDDIRTVIYEVRKMLKINVSLNRNIHIIALPHGTGKVCLSDDQSETNPVNPAGAPALSPAFIDASFFMYECSAMSTTIIRIKLTRLSASNANRLCTSLLFD